MQTTTLQAAAIIGGKRYPAGHAVTATPKAIETGIKRAARADLRAQITAHVGDTQSLLGTHADVLGLLFVHMLADVIAITENVGNAAQRRRLEIMKDIAGDVDVAALAQDALARITNSEAVLTAQVKGLQSVVDEALTRSTQTAKVLSAAYGAQPQNNQEVPND